MEATSITPYLYYFNSYYFGFDLFHGKMVLHLKNISQHILGFVIVLYFLYINSEVVACIIIDSLSSVMIFVWKNSAKASGTDEPPIKALFRHINS